MEKSVAWDWGRTAATSVAAEPTSGAYPPRRLSFATRLTAGIGLVALSSLGLFAFLTVYLTDRDVSNLSHQDEINRGQAVASALAVSYASAGSWQGSQLSGVLTLATARQLDVRVLNTAGQLVQAAAPAHASGSLGPVYSFPIVSGTTQIGTVQIRAEQGFGIAGGVRHALTSAVGWSALVIAILGIGTGILLSRGMTVPLRRLTEAARGVALGRQGTRVSFKPRTREVAELSAAFNAMAGSLERQEQLRRRLVADVAHELRTPVAILQAWLEAMVEGVVEVNTEALSSLLDDTLRLSRIVQDLQVLASTDVDALSLELDPVDLAEVAAEATTLIETKIASAGLTLVSHLEPVVINGDRTRLYQVVSNLLTNAMKFTPAGGQITLTVAREDRKARLIVEDTGIGIHADELPHVFKRFWRGRRTAGRAGSGIGLAVVSELTRAHGGQVAVSSHGGQGTRFVVTLPVLAD